MLLVASLAGRVNSGEAMEWTGRAKSRASEFQAKKINIIFQLH